MRYEFAKKLGLSVKTLQDWDVAGKLPAKRTLSGYRFYSYGRRLTSPYKICQT
ncbi:MULTISPECIES: MerR family DNA-binding transcriptional regulator [unclassified Microcoleus]|uniref:MerR family DNA-binding transcriptional regulator n=1 Tax=unclassified Microcoleus TaxID=2642155 RepID=UPI003449EEA1